MRVHELAKELQMTSKWLLQELTELGVDVKNHMSNLSDEDTDKVRKKIQAEFGGGDDGSETEVPADEIAVVQSDDAVATDVEVSEESAPAEESAVADVDSPDSLEEAESPASETQVAGAEDEGDEDGAIILTGPVVVRDFADTLNLKPNQLIATLMGMNIFASINQEIDVATAIEVGKKLDIRVEKQKKKKKKPPPPTPPKAPGEGRKKKRKKKGGGEESAEAVVRPPIVTFLGHVDHGKTSLVDHIREANVVAGEAGGITQHVGAYTITKGEHEITFLDTPGHAAFTKMRARGANLTDIGVIVIAADAGIMPQTREAIMHARNAEVAIVIAINKMDLPTANIDRVKQQLQQDDLTPEDWGGETIVVPVSAKTGEGIDDLLEMILLQAEIMELRAVPNGPAHGYAIEAQLEKGRGPTATLLVDRGRLKVGNSIVCGVEYGKVKSLIDYTGKNVKEAGPSHAVKVMGLSGVPHAGAEFEVYASDREAKAVAEQRAEEQRISGLEASAPAAPAAVEKKLSLEDLFAAAGASDIIELPIIMKADVQGSMEALRQSLDDIKSDKVKLRYVITGVGSVTGNDIMRASASNAIVIGFNVSKENQATQLAKSEGVEIRLYDIIYELIDDVKAAMTGLLPPETRDKISGSAEIRQIFKLNKAGNVAGCVVVSGRIRANARARVLRNRDIIYKGAVSTLKRFQDDAKEVRDGQECGIRLENFSDFEKGDIVETYETETLTAEL